MSLFIDTGSSEWEQVVQDVRIIAQDDEYKLTFPISGTDIQVIYNTSTYSNHGSQLISKLTDDYSTYGGPDFWIHGLNSSAQVATPSDGLQLPKAAGTLPLCSMGIYWYLPGGKRRPGLNPGDVHVDIVYDPNDAAGMQGYDDTGAGIPITSDSLLVFGGTAALHWYDSSYVELSRPDPGDVVVDPNVCLQYENLYRAERYFRQRYGPFDLYGSTCSVTPHKRAVAPPPQNCGVYCPGKGPVTRCFVATAAYGSPLADEVQMLRGVRDNLLRRTRPGEEFFHRFYEHYNRFSPAIAEQMRADPEFRSLMRLGIVAPLVEWFRLSIAIPDASLEHVPSPWREFLLELSIRMERWTRDIELPRSFHGVEPVFAARELGVLLRYVLRTDQSRADYLAELESRREIPLDVTVVERSAAARALVEYGRTRPEIERILGSVSPRTSSGDVNKRQG